MSTSAPEPLKPTPAEAEVASGTDEDILRLRSRLDRELAMVAQKITDAEEEIVDMELAVRAQENGSRPKTGAPSPGESGTDKITARIKAVGDGINKIREWVVKGKEGEAADGPEAKPSKTGGDLEERLEEVLRGVTLEIRDREKATTELDRKLYDAQKELIKKRAEEQHVREMQVKIGETKQISEDLERKMAALDNLVKDYESSTKRDTGFRNKPKEPPSVGPKMEDRLQTAIAEALKGVAEQEKKVAEIEKELEHAHLALVEERARQQRVRAMQIRLRQARHLSVDMQRALSGMASSIESLRARAGNLLKPDLKAPRRSEKPAGSEAAPAGKAAGP